jgi:hypothetical protein
VRVTLADGNAIKGVLPATGALVLDLSVLAGTDRVLGLAMLAALDPVALGSSISHWEAVAFPNQLMEPAINSDLTNSVTPPQDLTSSLMTDIGWFSDADGVPDGRDACLGSPRSATVEIGSCVSTAPNTVFANGCRVADLANDCADQAKNHGSYISCIEHLEHALLSAGVLTKDEAKSLDRCAKHH